METSRFRTALLFLACIALPLAVGITGSAFTAAGIPGWYAGLVKPFYTPPAWVFAPAWTVLYILMGISLFCVLHRGTRGPALNTAVVLFAAQLALNFSWSLVFFGLHAIAAALVVLLALIALIAATIVSFRRISGTAAWLLFPYLAWCCFAATLNAGILVLN